MHYHLLLLYAQFVMVNSKRHHSKKEKLIKVKRWKKQKKLDGNFHIFLFLQMRFFTKITINPDFYSQTYFLIMPFFK